MWMESAERRGRGDYSSPFGSKKGEGDEEVRRRGEGGAARVDVRMSSEWKNAFEKSIDES
jgi:hypothetical protein